MSPVALVLLAFAMSADAFAAAIGRGVALKKPRLVEAVRVGLIFGAIEGTTPLVGWLIGRTASSYVQAWDHWIAFALLTTLGLYMIYQGATSSADGEEHSAQKSLIGTCLTALGTSIDAMSVGVSLAFINVNIWMASALIGSATALMVTIGIMLGRAIGSVFGSKAEMFGGLTLIAVGTWILFDHL